MYNYHIYTETHTYFIAIGHMEIRVHWGRIKIKLYFKNVFKKIKIKKKELKSCIEKNASHFPLFSLHFFKHTFTDKSRYPNILSPSPKNWWVYSGWNSSSVSMPSAFSTEKKKERKRKNKKRSIQTSISVSIYIYINNVEWSIYKSYKRKEKETKRKSKEKKKKFWRIFFFFHFLFSIFYFILPNFNEMAWAASTTNCSGSLWCLLLPRPVKSEFERRRRKREKFSYLEKKRQISIFFFLFKFHVFSVVSSEFYHYTYSWWI